MNVEENKEEIKDLDTKSKELLSKHFVSKDEFSKESIKNELKHEIEQENKMKDLTKSAEIFYTSMVADENLRDSLKYDYEGLHEFFENPNDPANVKVAKNIVNRLASYSAQNTQKNNFTDKSCSQVGTTMPVSEFNGQYPSSYDEIQDLSEKFGKNELKKRFANAVDYSWTAPNGNLVVFSKNDEIKKLGNLLGKVTRNRDKTRTFEDGSCGGLLSKSEKRSYAEAFDYGDESYTFGKDTQYYNDYLLNRRLAGNIQRIGEKRLPDMNYINAILKIRDASEKLNEKEKIEDSFAKYLVRISG